MMCGITNCGKKSGGCGSYTDINCMYNKYRGKG